MHYLTVDRFFPEAKKLRAEFDHNFSNPLMAHAQRFVWDYWHVPGEYTHLRTPAYHYFSKKIYERFHRHLVLWGREFLGCHDISPPWLSCYVEGCRQEQHQDVPHGPLAFVYSLTPPKRKFRGGETFIARPKALIKPDFNRLTLFNPSLPHGVRQVRGTHDPREGRLVIHGWFVNPRPFWVGPLTARQVQAAVDNMLDQMPLGDLDIETGFAAFRLKISAQGSVRSVTTLIETFLRPRDSERLLPYLKALRFPRLKGEATLTLPLRFDS